MSTFVQLIDLHTRQPAELERVLDQWRAHSMQREHIAAVEVERDEQDEGHLVLSIEFDSAADRYGPSGTDGDEADVAAATPEAATVVGLLDRPPRFRSC